MYSLINSLHLSKKIHVYVFVHVCFFVNVSSETERKERERKREREIFSFKDIRKYYNNYFATYLATF